MPRCFIALLFGAALNVFAQTPCENLKSLSLPDTNITAAESIPAGPYKPQSAMPGAPQQSAMMLPAYCRIAAILKPSPDSEIGIEVWLPSEKWNEKFQAVGNGGWAGSISFSAMASALQEGYATASTDTGHKGMNSSFGIGHPEKVLDYAYRAVHEMTVKSKALIAAFYSRNPHLSYWNGCSTGGRQGLMEAQRYPEDYDGIIAGAPANFHSHLHSADMALAVPILKDASLSVPQSKLAVLNKAVLSACDEMDGVKDGILSDPNQCHFDPSVLLCRNGDADDCLTAQQLESVKKTYAAPKMKNGEPIFPGKTHGSELGWNVLNSKQPPMVSIGTFQLTYQDPKWDWQTYDPDRDTAAADQKTGFINAIDPKLKAFKVRGGKLLLYHGWNDTGIAPGNTINYYSNVLSEMGEKQDDWLQLFMVPGMGHCSGGSGPDQANFMSAMERWREGNIVPNQITAYHVSNNKVDMTRPLCPYPQIAKYKGIGSTNDAANFTCAAPTGPRKSK
jgi:feruloyl esterase